MEQTSMMSRQMPSPIAMLVAALSFASPNASVAGVVTYICSFEYRVDEGGRKDERFRLTFRIDTTSRRAFMEGNMGISDVEIYVGDEAFSFTERTASGAVQTTIVTRDGEAVHSRNTVIAGQIVAAQHFGRCVPE